MTRSTFDLYRKKSISVNWSGNALTLDVPVDVFSSFHVDRGTRVLLRSIQEAAPAWGRALDLGCGYGPISLCLAKLGLAEETHALDRDALAVLFTERNARRNGLTNVLARGGLAYDDCPAPRYDAIISNLPAKAGQPVHQMMLHGACHRLRESGEVWLVVVKPLAPSIDAILNHDAVDLIGRIPQGGHVVYHYVFSAPIDPTPLPYRRGGQPFRWQDVAYRLTTWFNLPEFDTLSRSTESVLRDAAHFLKGSGLRRVAVWNPGHGHIPLILAKSFDSIDDVALLSRDLLSLRAARLNLQDNGFRGRIVEFHTADMTSLGPAHDLGLVIGTLREGEGIDVCRENVDRVAREYAGVPIMMGCSSSFGARIARALTNRGLRASVRKRRKGYCSLFCQQAS